MVMYMKELFENGQYNGHGVFTTSDGIRHEGEFENGYLVENT